MMSMQDFILRLNPRFSEADKEQCIPIVSKMITLAHIARRQGLLSLSKEIEEEEHLFFKTAVEMVLDGREPEMAGQVLQYLILADGFTGALLLERLIISEAVLGIQQNRNPHDAALVLASMLGERYLPLFNRLSHEDSMRNSIKLIDSLHDKKAWPEYMVFEKMLLKQPVGCLQRILRNIDHQTLGVALHGCGHELIQKVLLNGVSQNTCKRICEDFDYYGTLSGVVTINAQTEILNAIDELEKSGEIIPI
ncbi:MAG: hypothetical protein FWG31_01610 [Oscillospiraceae bacterium]|nr:hypothetical protein [Oscillospiraceae bacterium]